MIKGLGFFVVPDFSVPRNDWKPYQENVTILSPDGTEFKSVAKFHLWHFNLPNPSVAMDRRWRVTICLLNIAKEDVPVGCQQLVRQVFAFPLLREQLFDKRAGPLLCIVRCSLRLP